MPSFHYEATLDTVLAQSPSIYAQRGGSLYDVLAPLAITFAIEGVDSLPQGVDCTFALE